MVKENPHDGGLGGLFKDPEWLSAVQDPELAAVWQDIIACPENLANHQHNPKVMVWITRIEKKLAHEEDSQIQEMERLESEQLEEKAVAERVRLEEESDELQGRLTEERTGGRENLQPGRAQTSVTAIGGGVRGNIFGFGGSSFASPSGGCLLTKGKSGVHTVNPGGEEKDNSSGGHVVNGGSVANPGSTGRGNPSGAYNQNSSTRNDPELSTPMEISMSPQVGNVDLNDSSEKVRQKVREVWANKLLTPSVPLSSYKNVSTKRNEESNEARNARASRESYVQETTECPVCEEHVIASTRKEAKFRGEMARRDAELE